MQAIEPSARITAEIVRATSPMDFFSMVQHIESCICAKTLEILRARKWEGPLTSQDWTFAEELVLDPVEITSSIRNDGMLLRVRVEGYRAEEIRLHTEGELLCLCGFTARVPDEPRMFYTRFRLPVSARCCRYAAWICDDVLNIVLSREHVAAAPAIVTAPIASKSVGAGYAAAAG